MGIRGVQPLRDEGKQRYAFPARSVVRGPPVDASFVVLQAGVPLRFTAEKNGPPGAPVLFHELGILRGGECFKIMDGDGRALARRHMAPAAGTAYFPGPDSQIRSV